MRCRAASPSVVTVVVAQIPCRDENVHMMRCHPHRCCCCPVQVARGRSTGLWCLKGSLQSGEDSRPCRWLLLFVNQAGDLVESCDVSSVPLIRCCECFAQALCSAIGHVMMIPTLWGVHVIPFSSRETARPLRLPRCIIVGHVWSNNLNLYYGPINMIIGKVVPTIVYSTPLIGGQTMS
ncbi:hypothetical protein Hanom_Chr01g00051211 [Helianthus anomalus]